VKCRPPRSRWAPAASEQTPLFRFDTATSADLSIGIPVNGLDAGSTLVGIDYRAADGQLYGLARDLDLLRLYTIDTATGDATAIGAAFQVDGTTTAVKFGVDFNPAADRLRVVTDLPSDGAGGNTNNFRVNPNIGALVAIDDDLDYTGLPGGVGDGPEVTVAYSNNDTDPATGTTLFGIVSSADLLVTNTLNPPAFNTLTAVGTGLGVDTGINAGLDIFGPTNTAVAILDVAAGSSLFTVNTTTGVATLVGLVGDGLLDFIDVAVAPAAVPVFAGGPTNGTATPLTPTLFGTGAGTLTAGTPVAAFVSTAANVRTASGDVNGDGVADLIAVTGPGVPIRVTVVSGADNTTVLVAPFDPFGGNFTGGGYVGDAIPELVVVAGFGGGPRTAVFNGTSLFATPTRLINDFFAFPGTDAVNLRNGVFVAASDINGDGTDDLVFGGGPGGAPRVFILDGVKIAAGDVSGAQALPIANFFVGGDTATRGGVRLAHANLDNDNRGDLVVSSGEDLAAKVRAYRGVNFTGTGEPTTFQDITLFGGGVLAGGVFVG